MQTETRATESGLTVTILRPTASIAPLSNKQVEDYLANQPKPDAENEVWLTRQWELLCISVKNAEALIGSNSAPTVDTLKAKFSTAHMSELTKMIFDISGLAVAKVGEASAESSKSGDISGTSAAA